MPAPAFDLLARPIQQILWDLKWTDLRPIQVSTIREFHGSKRDILITARTAAGKTEAAFLPILSELYRSPPKSVGAIYVGPLKALINDQFGRLDQLCERAEIAVHRWHGDVDFSRKANVLADPSGVLLITPESLESMFVNRSAAISSLFGDVRYIVIDEIHALIGRERGTQLRSILYRLAQRIGHDFRIMALSATVGEHVPDYARWMRPNEPERVVHLHDPGERKNVQLGISAYHRETPLGIDGGTSAAAPSDPEQETPADLIDDVIKSFCGRKNLLFCNRREDVEWLADQLNERCTELGRPTEFLVHHGALSREIREHAEQEMKGARPATTVCSSTLELGIDIGNVASVGQLGPPWSVNSQVQRLGRSGRKEGESHVLRVMLVEQQRTAKDKLVERLYPRLLQAIAVTELMKEKWVEPPASPQFDFSTLVQQLLSILAETGGCRAGELFRRLVKQGAFQEVDETIFATLLRGLGQRKIVEQTPDGLLILAPAGELVVRDRSFYSAFSSEIEFTVTHDGRQIGMLPAAHIPNVNDHVILGARRWQVSGIDVRRQEIQVRPARGRKPPRFTGRGGDIHPRVRQAMLGVLLSDQACPYLNDIAASKLNDARSVFSEARVAGNSIVATGPNSCLWFTWTGTRAQQTLCLLARQVGLDVVDHEIAIEFNVEAGEVIRRLRSFTSHKPDPLELAKSVPVLALRKFDEFVSDDLLAMAYATSRIDLEGAVAVLATTLAGSSSVDEPSNPELKPLRLRDEAFEVKSRADGNPSQRLTELEFVAFDVETTGLMPVIDRIVEIAAVRFRLDGTVVGNMTTLVDPGRPIPPAAQSVHGISDDMVRGQPSEQEAVERFFEFINTSPAILAAHNATFDLGFVAAVGLTNRLNLPSVRGICSLELTESRLPHHSKCSLSALAERFGLQLKGNHRALTDSRLLSELFPKLIAISPRLETEDDLFDYCSPLSWEDGDVVTIQAPAHLGKLTQAVESRRPTQLLYETRDGHLAKLLVTPSYFIRSQGRDYLGALCHVDNLTKHYRLDRLRQAQS